MIIVFNMNESNFLWTQYKIVITNISFISLSDYEFQVKANRRRRRQTGWGYAFLY